jgi:hypothetical protein
MLVFLDFLLLTTAPLNHTTWLPTIDPRNKAEPLRAYMGMRVIDLPASSETKAGL